MNKIKITLLICTIVLLWPVISPAQMTIKKRSQSRATMTYKPVEVFVFSTLHVNCNYYYIWKGIPSTYGTVWVDICKADKSSCSGGLTKSNSGVASFKTNMGMAGKNHVIKVYTQDRKFSGYSNPFFVDGMLPQCCPDGRTLPPCD